jgi:hypothetical protein
VLTRAALACAIAVADVLAAASGAVADGPVQCAPGTQFCFVDVSDPGDPGTEPPTGGSGSTGGERVRAISPGWPCAGRA